MGNIGSPRAAHSGTCRVHCSCCGNWLRVGVKLDFSRIALRRFDFAPCRQRPCVALDHGSLAALQTDAWGGATLLAGILLLIPGFITDIIALVLLVGSLRRAFVGAAPRQEDRVVDLAPEQWHQVPDPSLSDHRKDERRH